MVYNCETGCNSLNEASDNMILNANEVLPLQLEKPQHPQTGALWGEKLSLGY